MADASTKSLLVYAPVDKVIFSPLLYTIPLLEQPARVVGNTESFVFADNALPNEILFLAYLRSVAPYVLLNEE